MRFTFSKLTLTSAAMAAIAFATIPAMATTATTLKVPFNFTVDGKVCPAGSYTIKRIDSDKFVTLQSNDSSASFTWIAGSSAPRDGQRVVLSFDTEGKDHALRSIQYGPVTTPRLDAKSWKTAAESISALQGQ
jgi:hypothetical protein